jgi:cytochrome c biogenesis protein CcmG/thiol:disulfide interchange protein DsbE
MAATRATKQDKKSQRNTTGILIGAAGGLVVVLLVLAVVLGTNEVDSEYGSPTIEGQGLTIMPSSASVDTSANGATVPTVIGEDFDGSEVEIRNDDGRAKAIFLLAHWCPHCQAEVPRIQQWLDETGGMDGVDIYSVSTSMSSARDNFPASDWLEGAGWTPPVIRDDEDNSVYIAYGAGGFPYIVYVNADGTVAARTSGEISVDEFQNILASLEQ